MRNRMYGGVRGRKTKVGEKLLCFPPTRFYFRTALVPQGKRETLNVGKMMEEFHNGALSFTIIPLSRCLTGGSNNMFNQTN